MLSSSGTTWELGQTANQRTWTNRDNNDDGYQNKEKNEPLWPMKSYRDVPVGSNKCLLSSLCTYVGLCFGHSFVRNMHNQFSSCSSYLVPYSFGQTFIYSSIQSFIHSTILSFIHSLIYSIIHSFIYSLITGRIYWPNLALFFFSFFCFCCFCWNKKKKE